jgi:hypothetical protein
LPEKFRYPCAGKLLKSCDERSRETFISLGRGVTRATFLGGKPLAWLTYTDYATCFPNVLVVKFRPCPP